MLPYFELPSLELGPFTINAFGVMAVVAILTGWRLTLWRAGRLGLHVPTASRMCRVMLLFGLAGAWLARIRVYSPGSWTGFSSFGGLFLGLAAGMAFLHWGASVRGDRKMWRYIDAAAFVFPIAWFLARMGCALAHDHPGIQAAGWLTVAYPGGPRYDLGLLGMLYMIPVMLLFVLLDRRPRAPGLYTGLFLLVYGPFRFGLDLLEQIKPTYWGVGADQWGGALTTLVGILALLVTSRGSSSGDDTPTTPAGPPR